MSVPLLASIDCTRQVHLIIGDDGIAAKRAVRSLEAGALCTLLSPNLAEELHFDLRRFTENGKLSHIQRDFEENDLKTLGRAEVDGVVDMSIGYPLCANGYGSPSTVPTLQQIAVSLFFPPIGMDPSRSAYQRQARYTAQDLAHHTNGQGCKLASRIRREIVSALPPNLGETCRLLGSLRTQLQKDDGLHVSGIGDDSEQTKDLNTLILDEEDFQASKTRRMRWLTQLCEYYPLSRLTQLGPDDISTLLEQYRQEESNNKASTNDIPIPVLSSNRGTLTLVGAGPGHPDLLTQMALNAINTADLVLADKLIPAEVLALIPRRTEIFIARKFPGNAEKAQQELQERGLAALRQGKSVIRLKQGDPYIFGRGGEEVLFFRAQGFKVSVIPGLTSALTATALAGIPATHRGVADQLVICTGTGRNGALPQLPEYSKTKTAVILMALHRIDEMVVALGYVGWGIDVPCAVVERASCRDQRVIRTRLRDVARAIEVEGSRPPGLLVVGWACHVLNSDEKAEWIVEEGLDAEFWFTSDVS